MNMKKKLVTLGVVAAMLLTSAGATLAYFTDTDSAENVMTTGNVEIKQIEEQKFYDENGNFWTMGDFVQGQKLLPTVYDDNGDPTNNVVDKIVSVKNIGSEDAYIRTFVLFEDNTDTETGAQGGDLICMEDNVDSREFEASGFYDSNDELINVVINGTEYEVWCYTYNKALPAGEISVPSLLKVWLDSDAEQEDMELVMGEDGEYRIIAFTQAVQAAGFDTAEEAFDAAYGPWADVADDEFSDLINTWIAEANVKA